jgi:hypothetical protein
MFSYIDSRSEDIAGWQNQVFLLTQFCYNYVSIRLKELAIAAVQFILISIIDGFKISIKY